MEDISRDRSGDPEGLELEQTYNCPEEPGGLWSQTGGGGTLCPSLATCVTLGKLFNFSGSHFLHL